MDKTLESPGSTDPDGLRKTLERLSVLADTIQRRPGATIVPAQRESDAQAKLVAAGPRLPGGLLSASVVLGPTLGEGGMGVVRAGTQISLGREVAVKSLREGVSSPALSLKLLREAWITSAVDHPNVVPIYDLGLDTAGAPTLVMKRVGGVAWSELLARPDEIRQRFGMPPEEWSLRVLIQVSNAVSAAHKRGILHRDLKPENVMIGELGEVYLLDWGLAVALEPDAAGRLPLARDADEMAGTPAYMAPEMLGGLAEKLGPRTDVYLLGATLYEILTGQPPHRGATLEMLIVSVLLSRPTFPRDVPDEAAHICVRAMQKEPDHRYESVEELRFAIEAFLRHRESAALSSDASARLVLLESELADGEGVDRRKLYDGLGECRFGYRAALRAWPGNEAARDGLVRAVTLIVNHELKLGDAKAAEAILADLVAPPVELARRVAEAVARSEQEATRLAKLDRDLDPLVGMRTRAFLVLLFGALWSVLPIVEGRLPFVRGRLLLGTILMVLFSLLVGIWARETLSKTAFNRRAYGILVLSLVANTLLTLAVDGFQLSREAGRSLMLLLWFFAYAMVAITLEWRAYPTVLATLGAFAVSVALPSLGPYASGFSGVAFAVNMTVVWRPKALFGPPERS
jgi:serine/threonine-protein kinase